ncbi:MAG: hypothetical protein IT238_03815 [Bacteroidia bacterium]|nr:hypothetical protein [Bacteroidia bacterium]
MSVLLLSMVVPPTATLIIFKYQKKQIKKEIKRKMIAGIDKNELILLKFTEKENCTLLKWKHAKEFEYQKQMYDIVDSFVIRDTTYYYVWWDSAESSLYQQLNQLLAMSLGHNAQHKTNQDLVYFFFKTLYCNHNNQSNTTISFVIKDYSSDLNFSFANLSLHPITPPPEQRIFS